MEVKARRLGERGGVSYEEEEEERSDGQRDERVLSEVRFESSGCCIYVRNDLTCSRAHTLESSEFSTIWLRLPPSGFDFIVTL
ncbi:hypothetical protein E2C01_056242 [Portunus trituberculatus]|uniref:Uncharacterized protein n=1 Tax=Portunus trituberculatus TaxID=210409 RepID=A0A5B7GX97_PORTR|nr:hypothetical protein [Portunus trituberculatus]